MRVSGPALGDFAQQLLGIRLAPRVATLRPFVDAQAQVLDQGLAIYFPAPHSYTGEDVLELQAHGGPVVLQLLLRWVLEQGKHLGLRLARPGEFTERAFLNDKLDLAQAEAVADLIDASTEQAARGAARSLQGEFSTTVNALVKRVIALRTLVEATLDFPEEEIDFLSQSDALGQLAAIEEALASTLGRARQGALLREGVHVVLAGQPNVGKSSLLNALAGAEVAIVTPIAGTTRDKVQQTIQIEGVPLVIVDTAGLRESNDEVEKIGIERTWDELSRADVVLHLRDGTEGDRAGVQALDRAIEERLPRSAPRLTVYNKADLMPEPARAVLKREDHDLLISAKTGEGLDTLRARLLAAVGWQSSGGEALFVARERHLQALQEAQAHVRVARVVAEAALRVKGARNAVSGDGLDLFAEELRLAQLSLSRITGAFSADDLLGVIFSQFCIGK